MTIRGISGRLCMLDLRHHAQPSSEILVLCRQNPRGPQLANQEKDEEQQCSQPAASKGLRRNHDPEGTLLILPRRYLSHLLKVSDLSRHTSNLEQLPARTEFICSQKRLGTLTTSKATLTTRERTLLPLRRATERAAPHCRGRCMCTR